MTAVSARILVAAAATIVAAARRALEAAGLQPQIAAVADADHLAVALADAWDLVVVDPEVADPAATAERLVEAGVPVVALADLDEPAVVALMRRGVRDVVPP